MAIFSANRTLQTLMDLQPRALLISSCFRANRRYNSSVPVRYIPKGHQIKKTHNLRRLESSGEKEANSIKNEGSKSGRGTSRVPKFDNSKIRNDIFNEEIMETSDIFEQVEEFPELKDATGPALGHIHTNARKDSRLFLDEASNSHGNSTIDRNEVIDTKIKEDVEKMAIELLAARAFTAVELQKKLRGKKYPLDVVEPVIADLKSRGLLNDGLYAETFSRSRWISSTWGPRRIKQALMQKGVSAGEADTASKQVFEEDDNDPSGDGSSHHMQHGMSKLSLDRLFLQASKQWLRGGRDTSPENRKSRIVRWLQYRGFNWGVTSFIVKKLESQYPP